MKIKEKQWKIKKIRVKSRENKIKLKENKGFCALLQKVKNLCDCHVKYYLLFLNSKFVKVFTKYA